MLLRKPPTVISAVGVVYILNQSNGTLGPGGLFPWKLPLPRSASSSKRAAAAVAKRPALW